MQISVHFRTNHSVLPLSASPKSDRNDEEWFKTVCLETTRIRSRRDGIPTSCNVDTPPLYQGNGFEGG